VVALSVRVHDEVGLHTCHMEQGSAMNGRQRGGREEGRAACIRWLHHRVAVVIRFHAYASPSHIRAPTTINIDSSNIDGALLPFCGT